MKRMRRYLPIAVAIIATIISVAKAEDVCKVTDPTGTPLNVRSTPNGQIVGTVRNDTEVYIEEVANDDKGQPWGRVSVKSEDKKKVLGWVIREFISCYKRQ
jgi:Bacterial SH3 domain